MTTQRLKAGLLQKIHVPNQTSQKVFFNNKTIILNYLMAIVVQNPIKFDLQHFSSRSICFSYKAEIQHMK